MKLLKDDNLMLRETLRREQQVMRLYWACFIRKGAFVVQKGCVWCKEVGRLVFRKGACDVRKGACDVRRTSSFARHFAASSRL